MFRRLYFALLFLLAPVVACSGPRPVSHEELQSDFRAAISLNSETELFLAHLDAHAYSQHFIQAHLSYLEKQGSQIQSELSGASAAAGDDTSLNELKLETGELTQTLASLRPQLPNASVQGSSISRLHSIREHLEASMPR